MSLPAARHLSTRLARQSRFLAAQPHAIGSPLCLKLQSLRLQASHLPRTQARTKFTVKINRRTGTGSRSSQLAKTFNEQPFAFSGAVLIIGVAIASLIYAQFYYINQIKAPYISFPEKIAAKLRRALWYTNQEPDPKKALEYYKEALALCEEEGLHPFSDEVIGLKIQIAKFLEGTWHHVTAAKVLEQLLADCRQWLEKEGNQHIQDGRRTVVLGKTVGIGVKLGELYSHENIKETENAEKALVGAVETVLREKRRRETEGVKPGEGDWMSNEEIGGALESLGQHYESRGNFYLATPLFLQALTLCPPTSCHAVILMNNLATSLAQQKLPRTAPSAATLTPASSKQALTTAATAPRETDLVAQAILWAQKARTLSKTISPADRTEECDMGCAVATHNLGEFAEMRKDFVEATKRYREAEGLASTLEFSEGIENARRAIQRLEQQAKV